MHTTRRVVLDEDYWPRDERADPEGRAPMAGGNGGATPAELGDVPRPRRYPTPELTNRHYSVDGWGF